MNSSHFFNEQIIQRYLSLGNDTIITNNDQKKENHQGLKIDFPYGNMCSFTKNGLLIPYHSNTDFLLQSSDENVLFFNPNTKQLMFKKTNSPEPVLQTTSNQSLFIRFITLESIESINQESSDPEYIFLTQLYFAMGVGKSDIMVLLFGDPQKRWKFNSSAVNYDL
jgi:hypothetical protein